ncbi:MAG: hypothetical protein QOJ90_2055 [Actinomycetota bacterium]|jgi:hypothetical protein|nr:hypothetical protein [Actinomycetota bacterium]
MHRYLRRCLLLTIAAGLAVPLSLTSSATATTAVSVRTVAHQVRTSTLAAGATQTLRLPSAAHDIAVHWRGAPNARVVVSLGDAAGRFGPAVDAGRDEVGEQRGNGRTYGALLAAHGAVAARVTTDRAVHDLAVLGLADGQRVTRQVSGVAAAVAAVSQPPVLSRAQWGADESLRFDSTGAEIFPPAFYTTKKLIVHHTAGANNDPDPAATIRSIYYYHAVTQGWGDIGYNFLIDETGRIYEGRHSRDYPAGVVPSGDNAAGQGVTGAHTGGWNSGTVGVALLGTLTDRDATAAARDSLTSFLAWEADRNAIDPKATSTFVNPVSGATITTANIAGHRDYASTECPGGVFYASLPALRTAVADRIAGTPGSTPPPPDTTAPTTPNGLTAVGGYRSVALSWAASTDNVAVTGYAVARSTKSATTGFTQVATTTVTTWTNGGLGKGKRYWYRVRATDAAGNVSAWSAVVSGDAA